MWAQLKLKTEEVSYFCSQLEAHAKHPSVFLFYLSAFLSSARSVTFHVQKRARKIDGVIYEELREKLLNDDVCAYFIKMRNYSEKEGYPPLEVQAQVGSPTPDGKGLVWSLRTSCKLFGAGDTEGLRFIQNYLHDEWDFSSTFGPAGLLRLIYRFSDFPGREKNVITLCRAFSDRLWNFVSVYRWHWEKQNDPDAADRNFDKWLSPGYELPDA